MKKKVFLLFVCHLMFILDLSAYNLRKTTFESNGSVIHSIYQDGKGLIWLGTNAGICTFDGKSVVPINGFKGIRNIHGTLTGEIYAETLYGLNVLNTQSDSVASFGMFNNITFSATDGKGTHFIVQGNGSVYYKTPSQKSYDNIIISGLMSAAIKAFFVDDKNMLRIIVDDGTMRCFEIQYNHEIVYLGEKPTTKVASNILFCFISDERIFIIDNGYRLGEVGLMTGKTSYIENLKAILSDKGEITCGVIFKNEFYLGTEAGLFVIRNGNAIKIPLKMGITSLLKDKFQDLIWIGTMGDGVYTYSYDPHFIKSNLSSELSVSKPITAICLDDEGMLWIGTEGDGIVLLPHYNSDEKTDHIKTLSDKDGLPDHIIHSFHKSEHGVWIGCKQGLAFYSYKSRTIIMQEDPLLKDIHGIYEQDSVLWLACYGKGIVKVNIIYKDGQPVFKKSKLYSINNGDEASNRFLSICEGGDNILFTNRGNGIFRVADDMLEKLDFSNDKFVSTNQVVSISKSEYIAATDFGIFMFSFDGQLIKKEHLLNEIATKDIINGNWSDYWFSTDNGLILYNTESNIFRSFDSSYGFAVTEYYNGASFKDEKKGILFFGGINGFTTIQYNDYDEAMDYMPGLYLEKLALFGIGRNISDFKENESNNLVLKADENFFSVTFNALDYIYGNNYTYYYKIGEGQWVDNGNSGTISFTDISPGSYDLYIKYFNKMLYKESYTQKLSITVLHPWYRSGYAYVAYFLLGLMFVYWGLYFISKRRKRLREEEAIKADQRRKEEINEAKLDFFTDIAHEFCTPLTLISTPCELILNQKHVSPSVVKYANIISRNAKRMNLLISDLMDFKQMELGYKLPEVRMFNVSEIADSIIDSFKINASGTAIRIKKQYDAGLIWNTDEKFLATILINLISNAVKYSDGESVKVRMDVEDGSLILKVSNKGTGIAKEDIEGMFNRFSVLAAKRQNGWSQNGLGLAVTASMIRLLSGSIEVESIPNDITTFAVRLPYLEAVDITKHTSKYDLNETIISEFSLPQTKYEHKDDRLTVAIIDDDPEMLWLLCNILSDEFNVLPMKESSSAIETLSMNHTDIILCDLMMNDMDGITLSKMLKSDKSTSHIPLIIISAVHDIEVQTEALNAGAELYVTKPFDTKYLKTTIRRLLGRKEDLKDYFTSALSAYEIDMGKLQHIEHRKFLKKVYGIISKNIQNEDISPDFIASELGMSLRTLYRKMKEATDKGLLEIIRDGKLAVAENLLLKSKLTIDEIVFKSGFSNRASFYRSFSKKYGCTPSDFIENNKL